MVGNMVPVDYTASSACEVTWSSSRASMTAVWMTVPLCREAAGHRPTNLTVASVDNDVRPLQQHNGHSS